MTTSTLTRADHRRMGRELDRQADLTYDQAEATRDRSASWQLRREAERLVELANAEYALADQ